jgi:hypothetical protein
MHFGLKHFRQSGAVQVSAELLAGQAIEHEHLDGMRWDVAALHQVLDTACHCVALARASHG